MTDQIEDTTHLTATVLLPVITVLHGAPKPEKKHTSYHTRLCPSWPERVCTYENSPREHLDTTERFKFQILTNHLRLEEALLIADSYSNSRYPYSDTIYSLTEQYGQPHQLALHR